MLYLNLIIGIFLHFIFKIRNAYTENKKFDWKRHLIITVLILPIGVTAIYFSTEILSSADAVLIGYTLDSVVKNSENYSWKKIGKF